MKLSLKAPLLILLAVFLTAAKAQDEGIAPSPAVLENGAVGFVPVLCTLLLSSVVSFFALVSQ